jgi:hypothetical protein
VPWGTHPILPAGEHGSRPTIMHPVSFPSPPTSCSLSVLCPILSYPQERKKLLDQFLADYFVPARLAGEAEKLNKQLAAAQQQAGGDKAFVEGQLREVRRGPHRLVRGGCTVQTLEACVDKGMELQGAGSWFGECRPVGLLSSGGRHAKNMRAVAARCGTTCAVASCTVPPCAPLHMASHSLLTP